MIEESNEDIEKLNEDIEEYNRKKMKKKFFTKLKENTFIKKKVILTFD